MKIILSITLFICLFLTSNSALLPIIPAIPIIQVAQTVTTNVVTSTINFTIPQPPTPSTSNQTLLGAPKQPDPTVLCVSRIIQQGLLRLPQLSTIKPIPAYSVLQYQSILGSVYTINYKGVNTSAGNYTASIVGICKIDNKTVTLEQVSYTKY